MNCNYSRPEIIRLAANPVNSEWQQQHKWLETIESTQEFVRCKYCLVEVLAERNHILEHSERSSHIAMVAEAEMYISDQKVEVKLTENDPERMHSDTRQNEGSQGIGVLLKPQTAEPSNGETV